MRGILGRLCVGTSVVFRTMNGPSDGFLFNRRQIMKKSPSLLPMYVVAFALCPLLGGCPVMPPPDGDDGDGNGGDGDGPAQGFVDADAARGGAL